MNSEGEQQRHLELQFNSLVFDSTEHRVAQISDVTERVSLSRAEAKIRMGNLLTSSVSHEMLTPLKCIVSFANSLLTELKHSEKRKEAEFILLTTKLVLSQV